MAIRFSYWTKNLLGIGGLLSGSLFSQSRQLPDTIIFHGGRSHTGVYSDASGSGFKDIKWKFRTAGRIFSSPLVTDEMVCWGSQDHNFYAVNKHSGKLVWKFTSGGSIASTAASCGNSIYFLSFDGFLYSLDKRSGKLLWKFKTKGEKYFGQKGLWGMKPASRYMDDQYDFFLSSPLIYKSGKNTLVCFGSSDSWLYALDAATGKLRWSFKTNGIIHTSPAFYQNKIYIGSWDTYIYALEADNGNLIWKFKTMDHPVYHQLDGIQSSPCLANGNVYFGCRDGHLYAINANTGKLRWKYDTNGSWVLTTPSAVDKTIFFGTSDSDLLIAVNALTGKEQFRFTADGYIYSSPAIAGNAIYFGDFSGELHALSITTGKERWKFECEGRKENASGVLNKGKVDFGFLAKNMDASLYATSEKVLEQQYKAGPIVSSPVLNDHVIYFGSADGYLYALDLRSKVRSRDSSYMQ